MASLESFVFVNDQEILLELEKKQTFQKKFGEFSYLFTGDGKTDKVFNRVHNMVSCRERELCSKVEVEKIKPLIRFSQIGLQNYGCGHIRFVNFDYVGSVDCDLSGLKNGFGFFSEEISDGFDSYCQKYFSDKSGIQKEIDFYNFYGCPYWKATVNMVWENSVFYNFCNWIVSSEFAELQKKYDISRFEQVLATFCCKDRVWK